MRTTIVSMGLVMSVALAGCGWNLPDSGRLNAERLWDPQETAAVGGGLFVRLTEAGQLVWVDPDGHQLVDLGVGSARAMQVTPDGQRLAAFVDYTACIAPDPREIRGVDRVEDCPVAYRDVRSEVVIVDPSGDTPEAIGRFDVDSYFNTLTFSPDGRWAIAWFDVSEGLDLDTNGVVDLTNVLVLDLQGSGEDAVTSVSIGFGADRVLFTELGDRAVVLSKDSVASVDLTGDQPSRGTRFRLTLDADQQITPVGVQLTDNGDYALITAQGQDDLYALRLQNPAINLINLSGRASSMAVVPDPNDDSVPDDVSVIVHQGVAAVDVVSHDSFEVETFDLDEPMNQVQVADRQSVLWSSVGLKDVYTIDHDNDELVEYRLENPPIDVHIAPGGEFAVALTRAEGGFTDDLQGLFDRSPLLEVLEIGEGRGRTGAAKLLDGPGVGLAFNATETRLDLLLLQEGQDYIYQVDLYTDRSQELEVSAPPVAIGGLPDGGFWITHDAGLGLVSFYNPESGSLVEVGGFALAGWRDGTELDERDINEEAE